MIFKELYENVTHVQACGQDEFMSHVDTTVRALLARYDKEYVLLPKEVWIKHININDDLPVREEYFVAIRDNVLFLLTGNGDRFRQRGRRRIQDRVEKENAREEIQKRGLLRLRLVKMSAFSIGDLLEFD